MCLLLIREVCKLFWDNQSSTFVPLKSVYSNIVFGIRVFQDLFVEVPVFYETHVFDEHVALLLVSFELLDDPGKLVLDFGAFGVDIAQLKETVLLLWLSIYNPGVLRFC